MGYVLHQTSDSLCMGSKHYAFSWQKTIEKSFFLHNRTNTHGLKQHLKTFADRFEHAFQTASVGEMWDALSRAGHEYFVLKYICT